jgi:hypothetical protein
MVHFQTKNFDEFWRVLQWKMMVNFKDIRFILQPFYIFCGRLVYFVVVCYIFPRVGILCQEKSGNPDAENGVLETFQRFSSSFDFS